MNKGTKCPICGKINWKKGPHPFIRVCATPNCNGVNTDDVQKLHNIEGYIFDITTMSKMTIEELEKSMKQNIK